MKKLLCLFVLIALMQPVFAFDMSLSEDNMVVVAGNTKSINVALSSIYEEKVSLSFISGKPWMLIGEPQPLLGVEPKNVEIFFSPFVDTPMASYKVTLVAFSHETGKEDRKDIIVTVAKGTDLTLDKITVGGDLAPTGTADIKFYVKNNGRSSIQNVLLKPIIRSGNRIVYVGDIDIGLINPSETKVVEKSVDLPPTLIAGIYSVVAELWDNNKLVGRNEQSFSVQERAVLVQQTEKRDVLFGFGKTITIRNMGNVAGSEAVSDEISGLLTPFVYAGDNPNVASNMITWNVVALGPGEEITFSYIVDYSIIILLVIIAAIGGWLFMFKFRTVRIRKYVMQKSKIERGSEFTMGVEIKNASGSSVKNIVVRDFVPGVFRLASAPGPKFQKKKMSSGNEISWKIDHLNKNEERILSYKIIPTFGVHGQLKLPKASVKFSTGRMTVENSTDLARLGVTTKETFI